MIRFFEVYLSILHYVPPTPRHAGIVDSHLLRDQDSTVSHLAVFELRHGFGDALLRQRELLKDRLDLVLSSELEHSLVNVARSNHRSLNSDAVEEERHVGDGEVALVDREGVDAGSWSHDGHDQIPLRLGTGCNKELVDGTVDLELFGTLGCNELAGSKLCCLILLAVGPGEHDDVAAHLCGELNGQVTWIVLADCDKPTRLGLTKASDTHDTDDIRGLDVVCVECVEDSDASAHLSIVSTGSRHTDVRTY